jgi:hypothetical protein
MLKVVALGHASIAASGVAPRNDESKISDSTAGRRRDARLPSRGAIASGFCNDIAL